jgi:hypothetical protein
MISSELNHRIKIISENADQNERISKVDTINQVLIDQILSKIDEKRERISLNCDEKIKISIQEIIIEEANLLFRK